MHNCFKRKASSRYNALICWSSESSLKIRKGNTDERKGENCERQVAFNHSEKDIRNKSSADLNLHSVDFAKPLNPEDELLSPNLTLFLCLHSLKELSHHGTVKRSVSLRLVSQFCSISEAEAAGYRKNTETFAATSSTHLKISVSPQCDSALLIVLHLEGNLGCLVVHLIESCSEWQGRGMRRRPLPEWGGMC